MDRNVLVAGRPNYGLRVSKCNLRESIPFVQVVEDVSAAKREPRNFFSPLEKIPELGNADVENLGIVRVYESLSCNSDRQDPAM